MTDDPRMCPSDGRPCFCVEECEAARPVPVTGTYPSPPIIWLLATGIEDPWEEYIAPNGENTFLSAAAYYDSEEDARDALKEMRP